jgi:hypothetical protein
MARSPDGYNCAQHNLSPIQAIGSPVSSESCQQARIRRFGSSYGSGGSSGTECWKVQTKCCNGQIRQRAREIVEAL